MLRKPQQPQLSALLQSPPLAGVDERIEYAARRVRKPGGIGIRRVQALVSTQQRLQTSEDGPSTLTGGIAWPLIYQRSALLQADLLDRSCNQLQSKNAQGSGTDAGRLVKLSGKRNGFRLIVDHHVQIGKDAVLKWKAL